MEEKSLVMLTPRRLRGQDLIPDSFDPASEVAVARPDPRLPSRRPGRCSGSSVPRRGARCHRSGASERMRDPRGPAAHASESSSGSQRLSGISGGERRCSSRQRLRTRRSSAESSGPLPAGKVGGLRECQLDARVVTSGRSGLISCGASPDPDFRPALGAGLRSRATWPMVPCHAIKTGSRTRSGRSPSGGRTGCSPAAYVRASEPPPS